MLLHHWDDLALFRLDLLYLLTGATATFQMSTLHKEKHQKLITAGNIFHFECTRTFLVCPSSGSACRFTPALCREGKATRKRGSGEKLRGRTRFLGGRRRVSFDFSPEESELRVFNEMIGSLAGSGMPPLRGYKKSWFILHVAPGRTGPLNSNDAAL